MVAGSQPVALVLLSVPAGWPSVPGCFSLFDAVPCPPRRPSPNWQGSGSAAFVGGAVLRTTDCRRAPRTRTGQTIQLWFETSGENASCVVARGLRSTVWPSVTRLAVTDSGNSQLTGDLRRPVVCLCVLFSFVCGGLRARCVYVSTSLCMWAAESTAHTCISQWNRRHNTHQRPCAHKHPRRGKRWVCMWDAWVGESALTGYLVLPRSRRSAARKR